MEKPHRLKADGTQRLAIVFADAIHTVRYGKRLQVKSPLMENHDKVVWIDKLGKHSGRLKLLFSTCITTAKTTLLNLGRPHSSYKPSYDL